MKIVIGQDVFKDALDICKSVVPKQSGIPLLQNVMLRASGDSLEITASDMEIAFCGSYDCKVITAGEVTLEAIRLRNIIADLPEESAQLTLLENDYVQIVSGRSRFKMPGMCADGFFRIPDTSDGVSFMISSVALREMIDNTKFSIATDESRYGMNGAFLEMLPEDEWLVAGEPTMRMVSSDGHRLSMCSRLVKTSQAIRDSLIPRKGLQMLYDLCEHFGGDDVKVTVNENALSFTHGRMTLFVRLLLGDFPDYRQIIPRRRLRRGTIPREKTTKALKRMGHMSSEKTNSVKFKFLSPEDGEGASILHLSASTPDAGDAEETIEIELEGSTLVAGFNAKYVSEALTKLKGDTVQCDMVDGLGPCVIHDIDCNDVTFIVMPMRVE